MGDLTSIDEFQSAQCARATAAAAKSLIEISELSFEEALHSDTSRERIVLLLKETADLSDRLVVSGGVIDPQDLSKIQELGKVWDDIRCKHDISYEEIKSAELSFTTSTGRPTCRVLLPRSF